jgi:hypothetical protein
MKKAEPPSEIPEKDYPKNLELKRPEPLEEDYLFLRPDKKLLNNGKKSLISLSENTL